LCPNFDFLGLGDVVLEVGRMGFGRSMTVTLVPSDLQTFLRTDNVLFFPGAEELSFRVEGRGIGSQE